MVPARFRTRIVLSVACGGEPFGLVPIRVPRGRNQIANERQDHEVQKASALFIALAVVGVACGDDSNDSSSATTPAAGSTGGAAPAPAGALILATDLPLQGASKDASTDTNNAISLLLEQAGGKAGAFDVTMKAYDDSTAAAGAWDSPRAPRTPAITWPTRRSCSHGYVQLWLRQDRGAGPERRHHWSDADGLARQHQPRPHQGMGSGRARQVLPDGRP